jgi:methyl-accepting chemotaxis protein
MRAGSGEVEASLALADEAGDALRRIVADADKAVAMVQQIAAATEEQSATGEQMARSVQTISEVSHESAAGVGQVASAAEGLGRLTEELSGLLARFRTEGGNEHMRSEHGRLRPSAPLHRSESLGDGAPAAGAARSASPAMVVA